MRREFAGSPDGWGTEEAWDGAGEEAVAGECWEEGFGLGGTGWGNLEES